MTTKGDAATRFETEAVRAFPQLDRTRAMAAFIPTEPGRALYAAYASADPDPAVAPVAKALRNDEILAEEVIRRARTFAKERGMPLGQAYKRLKREDPTFRNLLALHDSARQRSIASINSRSPQR
jgi:hypothetical protein